MPIMTNLDEEERRRRATPQPAPTAPVSPELPTIEDVNAAVATPPSKRIPGITAATTNRELEERVQSMRLTTQGTTLPQGEFAAQQYATVIKARQGDRQARKLVEESPELATMAFTNFGSATARLQNVVGATSHAGPLTESTQWAEAAFKRNLRRERDTLLSERLQRMGMVHERLSLTSKAQELQRGQQIIEGEPLRQRALEQDIAINEAKLKAAEDAKAGARWIDSGGTQPLAPEQFEAVTQSFGVSKATQQRMVQNEVFSGQWETPADIASVIPIFPESRAADAAFFFGPAAVTDDEFASIRNDLRDSAMGRDGNLIGALEEYVEALDTSTDEGAQKAVAAAWAARELWEEEFSDTPTELTTRIAAVREPVVARINSAVTEVSAMAAEQRIEAMTGVLRRLETVPQVRPWLAGRERTVSGEMLEQSAEAMRLQSLNSKLSSGDDLTGEELNALWGEYIKTGLQDPAAHRYVDGLVKQLDSAEAPADITASRNAFSTLLRPGFKAVADRDKELMHGVVTKLNEGLPAELQMREEHAKRISYTRGQTTNRSTITQDPELAIGRYGNALGDILANAPSDKRDAIASNLSAAYNLQLVGEPYAGHLDYATTAQLVTNAANSVMTQAQEILTLPAGVAGSRATFAPIGENGKVKPSKFLAGIEILQTGTLAGALISMTAGDASRLYEAMKLSRWDFYADEAAQNAPMLTIERTLALPLQVGARQGNVQVTTDVMPSPEKLKTHFENMVALWQPDASEGKRDPYLIPLMQVAENFASLPVRHRAILQAAKVTETANATVNRELTELSDWFAKHGEKPLSARMVDDWAKREDITESTEPFQVWIRNGLTADDKPGYQRMAYALGQAEMIEEAEDTLAVALSDVTIGLEAIQDIGQNAALGWFDKFYVNGQYDTLALSKVDSDKLDTMRAWAQQVASHAEQLVGENGKVVEDTLKTLWNLNADNRRVGGKGEEPERFLQHSEQFGGLRLALEEKRRANELISAIDVVNRERNTQGPLPYLAQWSPVKEKP